jgi:hypothetical protein
MDDTAAPEPIDDEALEAATGGSLVVGFQVSPSTNASALTPASVLSQLQP